MNTMSTTDTQTKALLAKQAKIERQRRIRNRIFMALVLGALAVKLFLSLSKIGDAL